jgi:hypothetical protein
MRGILTIICFRKFCLTVCYVKTLMLEYEKLYFYMLFCKRVKLYLSHLGRT